MQGPSVAAYTHLMLPTAGGLIATALVNVAFGFGHAYLWFCVCWGANGLLQVHTYCLPPAHPLNMFHKRAA